MAKKKSFARGSLFKIDQRSNAATITKPVSLKSKKIKEERLEDWIENTPDILGEEILIIARQYSDFEGYNDSVDILGLDKDARLVIVENKREGDKDHDLQAIRYLALLSTFTVENLLSVLEDYLNTLGKSNAWE
ncbi:MAG: endonuclease NucS domain-containing protein, partial [bacterium]